MGATIVVQPPSQPVVPLPSSDSPATNPTPFARAGSLQTAPLGNPLRATLPLKDDGRHWNDALQAGLGAADGGAPIDFGQARTDENPIRPITGGASSIGAKCPIIHGDDTTVSGRVVGGLSHEYAGLTERQVIPELSLGAQLEHQLNDRSRILGGVEYARDITEPSRYRVRTQASWELFLDPEKNLSLRTGVLESRNAIPQGERVKNLDYNLDVIWKF
jgi:hypothetical protein